MRRSFLLAAALVGVAACPAPSERRPPSRALPGEGSQRDHLLAASSADPAPAHVHVMLEGQELGGPNAIGRPGDLVIENDQVVFVIDQLGAGSGFAEGGGNIVDAADARLRKDELGQVFSYFGKFPRQGVYDTLTSGTAPDRSAWVQASGHELHELRLAVSTRYTLHAGARALLMETRLKNGGAQSVELRSLGDAIQWGGAEVTAPGKARGFIGPSTGPYIGGVGRFASYASAPVDGAMQGVSGKSWSDTAVSGPLTLAPGEEKTYGRVFFVGERPDTASLVAGLVTSNGPGPLGRLEIELGSDPDGSRVSVPHDARIAVRDLGGAEVMTIGPSGAPDRLDAKVPAGRWRLTYLGGGGRAGRGQVEVEVKPGADSHTRLGVTKPSAVHVKCVDGSGSPMPCKATFERVDGQPPPDLGVAHAAGPARNQFTTAEGQFELALAPGSYRVTASRGPEYALAQAPLILLPGERRELRLSLARVVDTSGYIAGDFHQHTMRSADSAVGLADRVISNVAEGVELAVASEHNVASDLGPFVKALHVENSFVSVAGDELTTDASLEPWGHANVYPLVVDAGAARGGAPAVRDRSPSDVWGALRKASPVDIVLQVNHPRSGSNGYFDLLGFDPKTGVGTNPAYDATFDALEIWNGRHVDARAGVLADFRAMLRTGHPVTPFANTDTHGIVGQEAGYPRTYVRVSDDAHLDTWDAARTADLVRRIKTLRDVVLTNGPMLHVTANGAPVGGIARGSLVQVDVRVESAPWIVIDKVSVLRASGQQEDKAVTPKLGPGGALTAHVIFSLKVLKDDALIVIAQGTKAMAPVLTQDADGDVSPWAMTGALWVDADGDGESLGVRAKR